VTRVHRRDAIALFAVLCFAATSREAAMPHVITPTAGATKKVVVVGAGPAGLEAARVSAARGHKVVLFEAADKPGGQVLLAAKLQRRREIVGIVEWLAAEVQLADIDTRFNTYAEAPDVLAENPDIVVIATGGLPFAGRLKFGAELATSPWDVLAGQVPVAPEVLLFDDHGAHEGLSLAEFAVDHGARLEYVSPERAAGVDVGGINYPAYFKKLYAAKTTFTLNHRLKGIRRDGNKKPIHGLVAFTSHWKVIDLSTTGEASGWVARHWRWREMQSASFGQPVRA